MSQVTNEKGNRYGRLTVLEYLGHSKWKCICDCGNEVITKGDYLRTGRKKSCGCIDREKQTVAKFKDDIRAKRLYRIWKHMKERCYSPNNDSYKNYGMKGIKICDEWKDNFINFYLWATTHGYEEIQGEYKDKLSIDRIDSSEDYSPNNCRWIPISDNCAIVSDVNKQLEDLSNQTNDEMIESYLQRKMEINQELQQEKKRIKHGGFFVRKPNYCLLKNQDRTKQYLFKSFKIVALFLNIPSSCVSYRVRKKNGRINEEFLLEKINKEEYELLRKKGIEVIV